jgi:HK97 family phage portal protein
VGMLAERVNAASAPPPRALVAADWDAFDDRWYTPHLGLTTDAGVAISAQTVFLCDAVLAAIRFRANSVALCPAKVYLANGPDREAQPDHYAQKVLRDPNAWQTAYEWTQYNGVCLSTWGNAYSRVIPGVDAFVNELWPLDPGRVRIVDQRNDGSLIYVYRGTDGVEERIHQEVLLHYKDLSLDGYMGVHYYVLIRNIVGVALAAEKHMAMFLKRGTRLSGILSTEQPLTEAVAKKAEESWNQRFGDLNSSHVGGVAMLGGGFKFQPMAIDHQKAQFVELQNFLVEKILRALGVPGVVVGYTGDKASTYASADAFFEKGGVRHCILPLVVSMEQRDDKVLLPRDSGLFVKRDLSVVERANTKDAFDILIKAAGRPIVTGNEARAKLDLNRIEEPSMDQVQLSPGATVPMGTDGGAADEDEDDKSSTAAAPPPADEDEDEDEDEGAAAARHSARARRLAFLIGLGLVRRELAFIRGSNGHAAAAVRFAGDPAGWRAWVLERYENHAGTVAERLDISIAAARAYCDGQALALLSQGIGVTETWEQTAPPRLAAIALGE